MKRAVLTVLLCIVLLLSGCGGAVPGPDFAPRQAFVLEMTAEVNGRVFRGELACDSFEQASLTFWEPEELAGVTVAREGGGYTIDVNGMRDSFPEKLLERDAPLRLLFDTVRAAVYTNQCAFEKDKEAGTYTAALTVNGRQATVVFTADGNLKRLTADRLTAAFQQT